MSDFSLSTEAQQIAIMHAVVMIHDAITELYKKQKELELLEETEELKFDLFAIKFRINTLIKVESDLLDPINKLYIDTEEYYKKLKSGDSVERLNLIEMTKTIQTGFMNSIMEEF